MTFNKYVEENVIELVQEIYKGIDRNKIGFPPTDDHDIVLAEERTWKVSWNDLPFSTYTSDTFRHVALELAATASEELKKHIAGGNIWIEELVGMEECNSEKVFEGEPMTFLHLIFTCYFWNQNE